jgi:hypothetical protein
VKNVFFALTLAAVAAIPASAIAGTKAVTITLDGDCDSFKVTNKNGLYSIVDTSCETWYGTGRVAKIAGGGKALTLGMFAAGQTEAYYVTLSYPFTTGGTFNMYITPDGGRGNAVLQFTDTYTVAGTPNKGTRGTKPALSAVKQ